MITIEFNDREFRANFDTKIKQARNPRTILSSSGRAVAALLRRHFNAKDDTEPNQLSERRSHFWKQVAKSVQNPVVAGNAVTVSINDPRFAQKVYGGTIKAKAAGALTIPVEERAYGRTAYTFEGATGLKLFLLRTGKSAFQKAVLAVKENNAKGFTVEYILTPEVDQKADPDALPPKSALEAAILAAAQKALDKQIAGNKSPE